MAGGTGRVHLNGKAFVNAFELSAPLMDFVVRGSVIYFVVVIAIRLLPKREIGSHSPSDMLALVMMGALVADGMSIGSEEPIDFLLLAVVVLAWDWIVNALEFRFPLVARLTAESPVVIVRNGRLLYRAMRHELITEDEILACVRKNGLARIEEVALATVEKTGEISVVPKER